MNTHSSRISMLALAAFSLFFSSCKKDEESPEEPEHTAIATITITNPVAGSTFHLNDVVPVNVSISASTEMHGYEILMINETAGDTVLDIHDHDHGTSFVIDSSWVNNVTDHSDMRLEVHAIVDHDGIEETKIVEFHCHPM